MCGRYSLTRRQAELIERFGIEQILGGDGTAHSGALDELARRLITEDKPRYNIAPTQGVLVVLNWKGKRTLAEFKWGLIPFWAKDVGKTKPMINARCESVCDKPYFKQCISRKRCLIPADGFYEWRKEGSKKQPVYISPQDTKVLSLAGLWDEWKSPEGEVIRTCSIITTRANQFMSSVHDRMPVVIPPEKESIWLDDNLKKPEDFASLFDPCSDDFLKMHAVSTRVNTPKPDDAQLIEPIVEQQQLTF